jgi:hypothetical protein
MGTKSLSYAELGWSGAAIVSRAADGNWLASRMVRPRSDRDHTSIGGIRVKLPTPVITAETWRKVMARAITFFIAGLMATAGCDAARSAQYIVPTVRDVETRTGAPVLMGRFIDCKAHAPYEGTAFVQHGKVTMKRTTMNQCGNPNEPATAYYYISDPGFKGIDEANFSLVSGSALIVHITVR